MLQMQTFADHSSGLVDVMQVLTASRIAVSACHAFITSKSFVYEFKQIDEFLNPTFGGHPRHKFINIMMSYSCFYLNRFILRNRATMSYNFVDLSA